MACAPEGAGKGGQMAKGNVARRGAGVAGPVILLALLLAACGPQIGGPAPVINGAESSAPPAQITVQRGQTLSGIARDYHVPMQALAEANHLSPPYRILIGHALIIPGGSSGFAGPPEVAAMAPQAPVTTASLPPVAMAPPPPRPELASRTAPPDTAADRPIPLDRPAPSAPAPLPASPVATLTPPAIPAAPGRSDATAEPPAAASHPPAAPGATAAVTPPPAAHRGGTFLWPVRGHVLENYGAGPDGTHNDGINIAAPRGAPVQAADAGTVAYAGNELRGYGNLILIKHSNGWISAYAHCDLILVKTGQKVARGQVIARVGSTGNVSAPQLHFELRRGKQPVDPRDYLTPLPRAAAGEAHPS